MISPYYADDTIRLYLGDMRELLPALGETVDACVTDPPYGETKHSWDQWPDGWVREVRPWAPSLWCYGSMRMFFAHLTEFAFSGYAYSQDVVWRKPRMTNMATDRFARIHEFAVLWYRGRFKDIHHDTPREPHYGRRVRTGVNGTAVEQWGEKPNIQWTDDGTRLQQSVIDAPSVRNIGSNPTEKPARVTSALIGYSVPPGGLVLDPFAGSGATGETARAMGRRSLLIERRESQCEAIARRLDQLSFI